MEDKRKDSGKIAEDLAAEFLLKEGYVIIERNYMYSHSEIDIIAKKSMYLVFIEVRSKSGTKYGTPEDSMSKSKRSQVRKVAEYYLFTHKALNLQMRFDFIGVVFGEKEPKINHIVNAF
ncbi:MAG: YraN family protein [bacterium]